MLSYKAIKNQSHIWLSKGHIGRNASFSVFQAIITAFALFGSYRLLTAEIGLDGVGLWSLLVAGTFIARVADVSGAGALSRFVAIPYKNNNNVQASEYIHTVLLTILVISLVMGFFLFLASGYLVEKFIEPKFIPESYRLVPYVILSSVIFSPIAMTLSSAIDGLQRADQRSMIIGFSSLLLFLTTWLLVPKMGLIGFGLAQIIQYLFVILVSWGVLYYQIPTLGFFPWRWRKVIFLETTSFGLKLQVNSIVSLMTEPLLKYLLNLWGGLAMVGLYEFASRLVVQVRSIVVAGTQPLMAAAAKFRETEQQELKALLTKSTRFVVWSALLAMIVTIIASPLFSLFILKEVNFELIYIVCILAFAFGINLFSTPFYFIATGRGTMFWNIMSQIITAISVWIGGVFLGPLFGTYGIIGSLAIGIVLGSILTLWGNAHALKMKPVLSEIYKTLVIGTVLLFFICTIGASIVFYWQK